MPDDADDQPRRRQADRDGTPPDMHDAVQRLVQTMDGLAKTIGVYGPIIDKFAAHMEEEDKARPQRDAKERLEQQQLSVMAATVAELAAESAREKERARGNRYRLQVLLKSGSVICVSAMGLVDTGYIATSSGHFSLIPLLEIVAANAGLLLLAALLLWSATPVPTLTAQQVNPITEVRPADGGA